MAAPTVSEATADLYEALEPFSALESDATGWALLNLCAAICSVPIDQIHGYVTDTDERPGWAIVLDPVAAPAEVLDWLAQFVGTVLTPSMDDAARRQAIELPEGFERGGLEALKEAVAKTLTGPQTVLVDERYLADAWQLRVRVFAAETPNSAATLAAVLSQKPIGIVLTFVVIGGQDWGDLQLDHASWTATMADYATWFEARTDLP